MKGIHNIYRRAATLCLLLCCAAGNVWGQVTGDQYEDMGGSDVSIRFEGIESSSEVTGGYNNHRDDNAIDNNNNSYWQSSNNDDSPYLILQVPEGSYVDQISIRSAGGGQSSNYRPESVTIKTSDNTNGDGTTIVNNRDWGNNQTLTIDLSHSSLNRYVRIEFERQNNYGQSYSVRIYDIDFTYESAIPTIQHKPAKWYDLRTGNNYVDTFDDEPGHDMITSGDGSTQIQAAHTYIDTLYVKKGSSIPLWLPTISSGKNQNSARRYQRWYNYLTEGTFATGLTGNNIVDILTPDIPRDNNVRESAIAYRFTNGYVGGNELMRESEIMYGATFYYPTDTQKSSYTGLDNGDAGNNYYIVACDISGYTDFTEEFESYNGGDFGDNGRYIEPTLSLRVIYYIVGIGDSWESSYPNNYERLHTSAYQGGTNTGNEKYLEEYEINFPCDHIGNFTDELVALAREAQYYRIPGDSNDELNVELTGNTFDLLTDVYNGSVENNKTLSGDQRIISFRAKNAGAQNPWSVADGTTETILVIDAAPNRKIG